MKSKICQCGCGNPIIIQSHHKYHGIPNFLYGHSPKGRFQKGHNLGVKQSPEHIANRKITMHKNGCNCICCNKISWNKDKKNCFSEKSIKKISENNWNKTEEGRAYRRKKYAEDLKFGFKKGYKRNDEGKIKRRIALRIALQHPEIRKKYRL